MDNPLTGSSRMEPCACGRGVRWNAVYAPGPQRRKICRVLWPPCLPGLEDFLPRSRWTGGVMHGLAPS